MQNYRKECFMIFDAGYCFWLGVSFGFGVGAIFVKLVQYATGPRKSKELESVLSKITLLLKQKLSTCCKNFSREKNKP